MNIILDSCTIINLTNGQVIITATQLEDHTLYIGDGLFEYEILNEAQKLFTTNLLESNKIKLLDSDVTLSEFEILKERYNLGNGETECIALCKKHGYYIASDDRRARICAEKEIGKEKIKGSLYFLKQAVLMKLLTCDEAFEAYKLMKEKGGFLPKIDRNFLCS